jgi:thioesterase domain-containing protein
MTGPAEGDMAVVGTGDVEPIRIGEASRVAIGRTHDRDHRLPFVNQPPAELNVLGGQPRGVLARALVAQEFFNRTGNQRGISPQPGELVRMAQQSEQAVSDQVGRGLLPADHRDDGVGHHLVVGEPVAVNLGGSQRMEQARPWMIAIALHRLTEVGQHVMEAGENSLEAIGIVLEVSEHLGEVLGPGLQSVAVRRWQAEQFRRHDRWERIGKVGDHIHLPASGKPVEQGVDDILDVGAQLLDPPWGEGPGSKAADACVSGRIQEEHLLHHHLRDGAHRRHAERGELLGAVGAIGGKVLEDGHDVRVARDDPCVQEGIPMHRIFFAKAAVERIGVGKDVGVQQVVEAQWRLPRHRGWSAGDQVHRLRLGSRQMDANRHKPHRRPASTARLSHLSHHGQRDRSLRPRLALPHNCCRRVETELSTAKRALLEKVLGNQAPTRALRSLMGPAEESSERASSESGRVTVSTVQSGTKTPLFYLHVHWQGGAFYCFNLARLLGPDQPFYVLDLYRFEDLPAPPTIEVMAAEYIGVIRGIQPEGPYQLAAFCGASVLTYEIAQQLQRAGETVEFTGFIDPMAGAIRSIRVTQRMVRAIGTALRLAPAAQLDWFLRIRYLSRLLRRARDEYTEHGDRLMRRWNDEHPRRWRLLPASGALRLDWLATFIWSVAAYRPRRYPGKVTYFLAEDNPDGRRLWWGKIGKAGPNNEIRTVPGDHVTCRTEHLADLAQQLGSCLSPVTSRPARPLPSQAS